MHQEQLDAARAGMELAARGEMAGDQAEAIEGMVRAAKLGASQAGGFIAAVAMGMGRRGELSEEGAGRLARLAHEARSALGKDDQRLEFMLWARGGLAAASARQGAEPMATARAFSKACSAIESDSFAELMMGQPFYSSAACPNACDMALIVEQLEGALPARSAGKAASSK